VRNVLLHKIALVQWSHEKDIKRKQMISFDDTIDFEVCIIFFYIAVSRPAHGTVYCTLYVSLFTFTKVHSGAHRKS
jgi:hypothetical protein